MSNGSEKKAPKAKPVLRIVKSEPAVKAETPNGPKSNLARMMTAWADAIDRDVRMILDR